MLQPTKPAIMIIGGAEDKVHGREILRTFFNRSGGPEAHIAIIPSASREPNLTGGRYVSIFEDMGAKSVQMLDIREREQTNDPYWQRATEECTGVFLTGGDQLRLCALLADTALIDTVRLRAQMGQITLAGTSAGAAIMGHHMIAGGGSGESPNRALVDMATGLSIVPELIVDQHFHNRNRMARLMSAVSMYADLLGIGIDEDTCAMVEQGGGLQVLGKGTVTVIDPSDMTHTNEPIVGSTDPLSLHSLKIHILCHGDRYHLHKRALL
ncbi:cyanophycinase [Prochlorothrix hollandica]|nr:cyanophycinase [Prochlorothrix hollandica]